MRRIASAALWMTALVVIPLHSGLRAAEPGAVRIGVCLSLTGEFAQLGQVYLAGVQIGVDAYNASPAARIGRLELVVRDDESDPSTAAAQARVLIAVDKVEVIIGSSSSSTTLAMLPVIQQYRVPLISPSATNKGIARGGDDYSFRVLFDDDFQGQALARYTLDQNMTRAAALINERHLTYGNAIFSAFARTFQAGGGHIVAEKRFDRALATGDRHDFSSVLAEIRDARPEVILVPSYADDAGAILRESLAFDLSASFCGGDAWHKESLLYEAGNHLNGAFYIGVMDEGSGSPEMHEFMNLLDLSHDESAEPVSALGYDALSLVVEAMKTGRDRESIANGLYGIRDFPLVTGTISIDREHGVRKSAYIMRISKKGYDFVREDAATIHP